MRSARRVRFDRVGDGRGGESGGGPVGFKIRLKAKDVDLSAADLPSVNVLRDTQAPKVNAALGGSRVYWRGSDDASPWLALKVVLRRPGGVRTLSLGRVTFRGSAPLTAPKGVWNATLFAADSSGNTTRVALGSLRGRQG